MAKLEQGILGPFRGTVGTVVGYRWRDRWCMRSLPRHYHDRQSDTQLAQRSRFKAMIRFASPATPLLRRGLRAMAGRLALTEGNCFLRLNHPHFGTPEAPDYARLQFSAGHLPPVEELEYERTADGLTVGVRWRRGGGRADDRILLYAYCPAAGTGLPVATAQRGSRRAQFVLPQEFAGHDLHLWAFAESLAGECSPTLHAEMTENGRADNQTARKEATVEPNAEAMRTPDTNSYSINTYPLQE